VVRSYLAGIVGRRAAARRGVDVQLDPALTFALEIVGIDLDLVGQRAVR
jgi:hypothetical protein